MEEEAEERKGEASTGSVASNEIEGNGEIRARKAGGKGIREENVMRVRRKCTKRNAVSSMYKVGSDLKQPYLPRSSRMDVSARAGMTRSVNTAAHIPVTDKHHR